VGLPPPSASTRWACGHGLHPDPRSVISTRYPGGTPTGTSNRSSSTTTEGATAAAAAVLSPDDGAGPASGAAGGDAATCVWAVGTTSRAHSSSRVVMRAMAPVPPAISTAVPHRRPSASPSSAFSDVIALSRACSSCAYGMCARKGSRWEN